KVPRPNVAAKAERRPQNLHLGLEAVRIDRLYLGREDEIASGGLELLRVALEVARIATVVLIRTELRRVDEDRGDDEVAVLFGQLDQRQMSFVECAHRGHEPDAKTFALKQPQALLQALGVMDGLHALIPSGYRLQTSDHRFRNSDPGVCSLESVARPSHTGTP